MIISAPVAEGQNCKAYSLDFLFLWPKSLCPVPCSFSQGIGVRFFQPFIHLSTQHIFTKYLVRVRHNFRC